MPANSNLCARTNLIYIEMEIMFLMMILFFDIFLSTLPEHG